MSAILNREDIRVAQPVREEPEVTFEYPGIPTTCDGA